MLHLQLFLIIGSIVAQFRSVVNSCIFADFPGKVYTLSLGGESHQASGPKCRSLCSANIECVSVNVVLVRGRGFRCDVMYDGPATLSDLVENPDAVFYLRRDPVELTSTIVNIVVSSKQSTRPGEMVVDGDISAINGWSAGSHATPKWLQVEFNKVKVIHYVDILPRCSEDRQAKGYDLIYDNGLNQVSRSCSQLTNTRNCSDTDWERYYLDKVPTSSLTVSASTFCGQPYYYGIRELRVYGAHTRV